MTAAAHNATGLENNGNKYYYISKGLEAALLWMVEDWEKSPNSVRMPDPWYSASLAKWEKFRSKWNRDGDISFVDLLNFFGNRLCERFIAPEPETPKELDDLIADLELSPKLEIPRTQYNADIIEAFRRGQKAGNR
jgi:hypothetical protein